MIKNYVITRNSATKAAKICRELVKTDEGKHLVRQILQSGKERLFPMTRKRIEAQLQD